MNEALFRAVARLTIAVLLCGWTTLAASAAQQAPNDDALRAAWKALDDAAKDDLLEQYEAEADYIDSFTARLVKYALTLDERDRKLLPDSRPIPVFDPTTHAPAQPIPRRALDEDSSAAQAARKRILGRTPSRRVQLGWRYDYALRDVVREPSEASRERRFENALLGALPLADLAEALVERALDDGAQRKALTAFAHAYTDRVGNVYPGITLFDAWSSGAELEMPDVDVLGILHTVLGQPTKWKAPVPDSQHKALYQRVGEIFQDARRHRGLRAAYARCYLNGASELEPLYSVCAERFHYAWEDNESNPRKLAATLPLPAKWNEHLAAADKRMLAAKDGRQRATLRIETLARDASERRAALVGMLRERGVLAR